MKSSKAKTVYVCQSCGTQSPRWMGKCPDCGQWNTMVEERVEKPREIGSAKRHDGSEPLLLGDIKAGEEDRFVTKIGELDRVLGSEANYAGMSFLTLDKLDTLQFGAPMMHVTGDRQVEHGLSTVGYDDEGVAAQTWDIIRGGVLVGYQLDRQMAHKQGFGRSNGCAFADQSGRVPLQRMPNVSLSPSARDVTLDDLLAGMDEGLYIVGDGSWSIDMQRYNFQFTGQRFFQVRGGKIVGQVKDVAYQSRTPDFWNAMEAVGGPATYVLGGAFNCGKGQPGQIAPVTHGCPAALFRQITILNTAQEGH